MIPTLFGITLVTFFVMKLAPGDPQMLKLRFAEQGLNSEALAALLKSEKPVIELPAWYRDFAQSAAMTMSGVVPEDPAFEKTRSHRALKWIGENAIYYAKWLKNMCRLDFGLSVKDKRPVTLKILEALPVTLLINFATILVIYLVSIPIGIWSAVRRGTVLDKVVMVKLFLFYSLPTFWVATMLLGFLAGGEFLDWFPIMGIKSDYYDQLNWAGKVADVSWHLFLPVTADAIGSFAFLARFSRGNFIEVVRQDYIRTARAKGLPEGKVLYKHGLRNALIPFVTLMGTLLPGLLGGSVIIEQIFSIPGMGMLSFEAVLGRDHNVIMGIAAISAFLTLLSLFLSDLLYVVVDPRIKLK
jgi:peptide/nickel transport system permease protein